MFVSFRVSNFRSIAHAQELSLLPAGKQKEFPGHILVQHGHEALNTAVLYGANGSGKSNLLMAIGVLSRLVQTSARSSSTAKLPYDPYLLDERLVGEPTEMELVFIQEGVRYRYGLQYTEDRVVEEWLFRKHTGREVSLFQRSGDAIDVSSGLKGHARIIDAAIEATRDNALFLSACDMLNVDEATSIFQWFKRLNVMDGIDTEEAGVTTLRLWDSLEYRHKIRAYLSALDLGLSDIDIQSSEHPQQSDKTVVSVHRRYQAGGGTSDIRWNFEERESAGTKKAFQLSGPVLWALAVGGVLVIDEIEAKMHPMLTLSIIRMFLDASINLKQAQLIFATHDTNLLSYAKFRRDQIYFSEKTPRGATEIYSLSDFRYPGTDSAERPDRDKEKRYLEGRYGAIPMLNVHELWERYGKEG